MFNINIFLKFKLHNCLTDNTILERTARVCDLSGEQGRYTLLVCLVGNEGLANSQSNITVYKP